MPDGLKSKIESLSPRGLWVLAVVVSGVAILLATGAVAFLLRGSHLWVGWQPIVLAAAVAAVVPVIGLWPLGVSDPRNPKGISKAAYACTPIRMVTACALGLFVLLALADKPARVAFGLWLAGLYILSLMAETVVLAVWLHGRGDIRRV